MVGMRVGVRVGVRVDVLVGVRVGVLVDVRVGVLVLVNLGVSVAVGVFVGEPEAENAAEGLIMRPAMAAKKRATHWRRDAGNKEHT